MRAWVFSERREGASVEQISVPHRAKGMVVRLASPERSTSALRAPVSRLPNTVESATPISRRNAPASLPQCFQGGTGSYAGPHLFRLIRTGERTFTTGEPPILSAHRLKIVPRGAAPVGGIEPSLVGGPKRSRTSGSRLAEKLARLTPEEPRQKDGVPGLERAKPSFAAEPGDGQILYDRNGTPIAFQDGEGNLLGPNDANLPPLIEQILDAGIRKLPATAYELWQQRNPEGRAEDYLKLAAKGKIKPLAQQLADAETAGDTDATNTIRRIIQQGRI